MPKKMSLVKRHRAVLLILKKEEGGVNDAVLWVLALVVLTRFEVRKYIEPL
jgi:hypothetical protein